MSGNILVASQICFKGCFIQLILGSNPTTLFFFTHTYFFRFFATNKVWLDWLLIKISRSPERTTVPCPQELFWLSGGLNSNERLATVKMLRWSDICRKPDKFEVVQRMPDGGPVRANGQHWCHHQWSHQWTHEWRHQWRKSD